MLEFALSKKQFTMPVGRIEYLYLEPVTFKEMLMASNQTDLIELIEQFTLTDIIPETAHDRLIDNLRTFFLTGGMPETVQVYIDTNDFSKVFEVHASIIDTYRDDFFKYGNRSDLLRLHRVFDYIPINASNRLKYVNFVIQSGRTIVPVEVKAGKSGSLKSLLQFIHQKKSPLGLRFDMNTPSTQSVRHLLRQKTETIEVCFDLVSLPLYMVEEAERVINKD
ncbi:hypothetical protein K8T06_11245 [bacterium]|nr:hypothetical protein [bacterium]